MPLSEEKYRRLQNLRPLDDIMIRALLRSNKPLAEYICEAVLGENRVTVTRLETQYDAFRLGIARSVEMDVLLEDGKGRVHNYEVQIGSSGRSPKRGRYHSSVLDVEYLKAGQKFSDLPETFVVFFCDTDPYGLDKPIYYVDRVVRLKDGTVIRDYEDRQHILYANCAWEGSGKLGKLLHDFRCSSAEEMEGPLMAEKMRYLKGTEKGRMEMSNLADEIYLEGEAAGFTKGEAAGFTKGEASGFTKGEANVLYDLVQEGKLSSKWAAERLGLSEERFAEDMLAAHEQSVTHDVDEDV